LAKKIVLYDDTFIRMKIREKPCYSGNCWQAAYIRQLCKQTL